MRENWQLLSKAVLKDVGGRSEVQQILEQVHHHKDEENAFLRNMQQGKSHKAGKLAETHGKCTTKCSHGLNETLRSSSLENTQKMVNYFQKQDQTAKNKRKKAVVVSQLTKGGKHKPTVADLRRTTRPKSSERM